MLDDLFWMRDHDSGYHAFAVITMCRVLHALNTGRIVSKPTATQWARSRLADPWKQLIDKAVAASKHEDPADLLDGTLDFIRYIKEQTMKTETQASEAGSTYVDGPS